jgi:release factor glutamine methyltransferase
LEVKCEPQVALVAGNDGLQVIRRLIAEAPKWLRPGGLLAMEIGAEQGAAVKALGQGAGYESVEVMPDYAGRDRIAMLRTHTGAEVE